MLPLANHNMISFKAVFVASLFLIQAKDVFGGKSDDKCNEYMQLTRHRRDTGSLGKVAASRYEFPHMAGLVYIDGNKKAILCGGILISDQYVLTAATCLKSRAGPPKKVRLGDLNINSDHDDENVQEYTIIEQIVHPEYKPPKVYNDIGLVKLDRPVVFSKAVFPACLQVEENFEGKPIATGWGRTELTGSMSDQLMKVTLDLFTNTECGEFYKHKATTRTLPQGIENTMLCTGGKSESKSTCQGDTGGPVQVLRSGKTDVYNIVGIVSFGISCGIINAPEVATRVSSYVPWIESHVWP